MKSSMVCILLLTAISAAFLPPSLAAPQTAPSGSFLRCKAATAQELVSQLREDSTISSLYARHFATNEAEVISRLSALRPMLLERPITVQYYFVDSKGNIASKAMTLPRATAVFATTDGVPLLSWPFGNPLGRSVDLPSREGSQAADSGTVARTTGDLPDMLSAPPADVAGPLGMNVAPSSDAPTLADQVAMVSLPNPSLAKPSASQTGAISARWLAGLGGLAGALGAAAVLGSGDSASPPVQGPGPVPIPEPHGLAALAFGAAALGVFRYRTRK